MKNKQMLEQGYKYEVFVKVKGEWKKYGYSKTNDTVVYHCIEDEVFNCEDIKMLRIEG